MGTWKFKVGVALFALSGVTPLMAQTATQQTAAAPAEGEQSGIQDIVVTAQRRSESIQDVPIAI